MTAVGSIDGGATVAESGEVDGPRLLLRGIVIAIASEIARQDATWGVQDHTLGDWRLIAGEEDGEADAAILQGRWRDAEDELVQAMTVRLRMVEKVRRMGRTAAPHREEGPA
jgi:hypothetical protein